MAEFYLILGALLMSAAVVAAFRSGVAGAVGAYAGAWALGASGYSVIPRPLLLFWAIAVLLVATINMAGGEAVRQVPARLRRFIVGGALAGMAAGLAFSQAGAILGSAAGVLLGAVAFARVARGYNFSALRRHLVAIGLPAVVTMSLVALGIQGVINSGIL